MDDLAKQRMREDKGLLEAALLEAGCERRTGNRWRCIFHNDTGNPNGGTYFRDGAWHYKCQSCQVCYDVFDVRAHISGKPLSEVLKAASSNGNGTHRRIVATYPYVDESGALLYEKIRYDPKGFSQRRPDGKGGWVWNLEGVRRVLYWLPELIAATPETIIFICEGEKDVDNLRKIGLVATCNFDGASKDMHKPKWLPEYNEFFKGRTVCVVADKDLAGRAHAQAIAKNLHGVAAEMRIIEVPDVV